MARDPFYDMKPNLVLPPETACPPASAMDGRDIVPCLGYVWPITVKKVAQITRLCPTMTQAKPKASRTDTWMVAMPGNRDVFGFTVASGTFRVAHFNWRLCNNPDGARIYRVASCATGCCTSERIRYRYPRSCPFTILPPGRYEVEVDPVRVCVPAEADGTEAPLELYLEYVTRDFVLAAQTFN